MYIAFRFVPAAIWMAVIFRASATPGLKTVPLVQRAGLLPFALDAATVNLLEWILRKSAHLFSYGLLALLLLWALGALLERRQALRWALAVTVLYAISDEVHQAMVPDRQGRWWDVAIDAVGAGVALGLYRLRTRGRGRYDGLGTAAGPVAPGQPDSDRTGQRGD